MSPYGAKPNGPCWTWTLDPDRDIFTAATTLGIQLANLTRLVDPETIAVGGGVTLAGRIFGDPLHATMEESLAQDSIDQSPDWSKPSSAATPASTARQ